MKGIITSLLFICLAFIVAAEQKIKAPHEVDLERAASKCCSSICEEKQLVRLRTFLTLHLTSGETNEDLVDFSLKVLGGARCESKDGVSGKRLAITTPPAPAALSASLTFFCGGGAVNGTVYNFTGIDGLSTSDFQFNLCGTRTPTGCNPSATPAVCQENTFSTGNRFNNSIISTTSNSVVVLYSNGSACRSGVLRSTRITITCSASTSKPIVTSITEPQICVYCASISVPASYCQRQGPSTTTGPSPNSTTTGPNSSTSGRITTTTTGGSNSTSGSLTSSTSGGNFTTTRSPTTSGSTTSGGSGNFTTTSGSTTSGGSGNFTTTRGPTSGGQTTSGSTTSGGSGNFTTTRGPTTSGSTTSGSSGNFTTTRGPTSGGQSTTTGSNNSTTGSMTTGPVSTTGPVTTGTTTGGQGSLQITGFSGPRIMFTVGNFDTYVNFRSSYPVSSASVIYLSESGEVFARGYFFGNSYQHLSVRVFPLSSQLGTYCPVASIQDTHGNIAEYEEGPCVTVSDTGCDAGYYAKNTSAGQFTCVACPLGFYTVLPNSFSCAACPSGFTSSCYAGSRSCVACAPGSSSEAGICEKCSPGTYAGSGANVCLPCTAGYFTNETGSPSCNPCGYGTYSNGGARTCNQCPGGTYSVFAASVCNPCAQGYYSSPGSSYCKICPANTYAPSRSSSCTACPPGTTSPPGSFRCN